MTRHALPEPDDPMIDDRGELVVPERLDTDPLPKQYAFVPDVRSHVPKKARDIRDMPSSDPATQHAIACILFYRLAGMTNVQIAAALKISHTDVEELWRSDELQESFEIIFGELINAHSDSLQAKIAHATHSAFNRVVELSEEADKDIVSLRAAQDILDRGGIRHASMDKASEDSLDGLRIVFKTNNGQQRNDMEIEIGKKKR